MKKTILEEILGAEQVAPTAEMPQNGVLIGRLAGFGPSTEPLVDYPGNGSGHPVPADATARLGPDDVGREVALLFVGGDPDRPLVIGPLIKPQTVPDQPDAAEKTAPALQAAVDGERVTFTAEQEIVLRCGAASITLTRAGKILIRGKYVLSRSSGVNRIKGGSIQLN
jgi:hypothetical protein